MDEPHPHPVVIKQEEGTEVKNIAMDIDNGDMKDKVIIKQENGTMVVKKEPQDDAILQNGPEIKMENNVEMDVSNVKEEKSEEHNQDIVPSSSSVKLEGVEMKEEEGSNSIINGDNNGIGSLEPIIKEEESNALVPVENKSIIEIVIDDDGPASSVQIGNDRRGVKRRRYDPFTQEDGCLEASKWLSKCRDCVARAKKTTVNAAFDVCRFQAFRKLIRKPSTNKNGSFFVETVGFCDPDLDPEPSDREIWMPNPANPPTELPQAVCLQLLDHLGDQVCAMIRQEQEALEIEVATHPNKTSKSKWWKRLVDGMREICDVCATTLFNYHWICSDCGFVACLACYKGRYEEKMTSINDGSTVVPNKKDGFTWLNCCVDDDAMKKCANNESALRRKFREAATRHELDRLELTQTIPEGCLEEFNKLLHQVRGVWNIPQSCGCQYATEYMAAPTSSSSKILTDNNIADVNQEVNWSEDPKPKAAPDLFQLEPTKEIVKINNTEESSDDDDDDDEGCFKVAYTPATTISKSNTQEEKDSQEIPSSSSSNQNANCNGTITFPIPSSSSAAEDNNKSPKEEEGTTKQLTHFVRNNKSWNQYYIKKNIPRKVCSKYETEKLYPNLPHTWYCGGTLLKLEDPDNKQNGQIFQDVWKRGQPVVVSNVSSKLNTELWSPESFMSDYGQDVNDLVNCLTGKVLKNEKILTFWKGFSDVHERIVDSVGVPMLLKLKDWPATEDFAKFSPNRFEDLMQALPLKEYTHRTGRLNLAARLPHSFMRPDLGPKMYIAYGHGFNLEKGTTVLHLDISDAVNCMVHVGIPLHADPNHEKTVLQAIKESDCDEKMIERVTKHNELPGALWHIYRPWDADKIRDLINSVSLKEGNALEANNDPIHDQRVYLDEGLRKRLREEYNVVGFPILQCAGDSVFIPAGAPHQVRNLHNCIKIAEDFVSPENVSHCFQLTEEFRNLSDTHTNHEDKLQIKNIVYHAVKDAMSVLMNARPLPQGDQVGNNNDDDDNDTDEPRTKNQCQLLFNESLQ